MECRAAWVVWAAWECKIYGWDEVDPVTAKTKAASFRAGEAVFYFDGGESMGKGSKPRPNAKQARMAERQKVKGESGASSTGALSAARPCWTFLLVDVTRAGRTVVVGTPVLGAVSESRIAVLANGVLGYAPSKRSRNDHSCYGYKRLLGWPS